MKKYLKVVVMAVFVLVTSLNVYKAQTDVKLSDALLKNVEALANYEGITSDHTCVYDGQYCILYLNGEVIFQSFRNKPEK